jgi:uncharacterized protein DUF4159/aerotolerance regulator-like protein
MILGGLSFLSPWLLLALAGLPILWWLLRLTPPAPRRQSFPAIRLLFDLLPPEETPQRTPPWLIALRLLLAALIILGFAEPLLNAQGELAGRKALMLVVDDSWAAAPGWPARQHSMATAVDQAERFGLPVILVTTAPPADGSAIAAIGPMSAASARQKIRALEPLPWPSDRTATLQAIDRLKLAPGLEGNVDVLWLSDGLAGADKNAALRLADRLQRLGRLSVVADAPTQLPLVMRAPEAGINGLTLHLERAASGAPQHVNLRALDDAGRLLSLESVDFAADQTAISHEVKLPTELRNRIATFAIDGAASAAGILLLDDRWRQRPVGLIAEADSQTAQPLLGDLFYVERALAPYAELRHGDSATLLRRDLAVLVMADIGLLAEDEVARLKTWIDKGGVLIRFAGPKLAQNATNLLPVRLRSGDRQLGGAMSWSHPARLAAFPADSPFAGLAVPQEVLVQRQVLAEPEVDLGKKTWARLVDGTPLVTSVKLGNGYIVLVHTTANASWSNLALSGLFVEMLQRLVGLSQGVYGGEAAEPLAPLQTLDGYGRLSAPPPTALPATPADLATNAVGPHHPPGYYGKTTARRSLNLGAAVPPLAPIGALPAGVLRNPFALADSVDLKPWLLGAALLLLLLDLVIALALRGLFTGLRRAVAGGAAVALALILLLPAAAQAQSDDPEKFALDAASTTRLAYVITGDSDSDAIAKAGLFGLSLVMAQRTAAELGDPIGLDVEKDELAFFPLLYWRVPTDPAPLSALAAKRLSDYLRHGGIIMFDTADQMGIGGLGDSAGGLRHLLRDMDVPPLIPAPPDHVLTKSFYLMRDFPGRYDGGVIWVEQGEGRVNDGVSGVIIGSNDWAGAWAIDDAGRPLYATVPGGDRQRELAYRFGVNLVMYALTGNYKSDQVHVPAILERLGQ